MTKEQQLQIIDNLIERTKNVTYNSKTDIKRCIDDANSFVRNTRPMSDVWTNRIRFIKWIPKYPNTDSSIYLKIWNAGKDEFLGVLASIKSEIELYPSTQSHIDGCTIQNKAKTNKIFIVHGHNNEMKLAVARTIEQLGLHPIILHEQPNKGRTIIEKFEKLSEDVGFAIVLLSAADAMKDGKYRARQNVILELGYFIAKLGRDNVIALYDTSPSDIEIPSDITGVLYEPYDKPDGVWRFKVVQELKAANYDVDANTLT